MKKWITLLITFAARVNLHRRQNTTVRIDYRVVLPSLLMSILFLQFVFATDSSVKCITNAIDGAIVQIEKDQAAVPEFNGPRSFGGGSGLSNIQESRKNPASERPNVPQKRMPITAAPALEPVSPQVQLVAGEQKKIAVSGIKNGASL